MATRFWVLGTGTWDNTTTTNWAASSGGAGGQSVPAAGDTVTFDGSSGGGTVTVAATINGSNTISSLTTSAFTGTLAFNTNNPSITMGTWTDTGSGAHTISLGSGTFTINGTSGTVLQLTGASLTLNANTSTIDINATATASRTLNLSKTLNVLSVTNPAGNSFGIINGFGAFTAATITFTNVYNVQLTTGGFTASTSFTWTGPSITQKGLMFSTTTAATVSVANAASLNWVALSNITKAGAGSITANNSFDCGGNTGITFNQPGAPLSRQFTGM